MRILFAAADRDLLACYQLLLSEPETQVVTVFDGIQAMTRLESEAWELVILTRDLPRISYYQIVKTCNLRSLPVLVLTPEPVWLRQLLGDILPSGYLPLPFQPEELRAAALEILENAASPTEALLEDYSFCPRELQLRNQRLTAREARLLADSLAGPIPDRKADRVYINALNVKLARCGLSRRLRYETNLGYRLVTENE